MIDPELVAAQMDRHGTPEDAEARRKAAEALGVDTAKMLGHRRPKDGTA